MPRRGQRSQLEVLTEEELALELAKPEDEHNAEVLRPDLPELQGYPDLPDLNSEFED